MKTQLRNDEVDPAGVFACALSIWNACKKRDGADSTLNLSDAYNGIDQLMREAMRVAEMFEKWASQHVAFEETAEVWPYFLEDRFGRACFDMIDVDALAGFDQNDCLRVACKLQLPLRVSDALPLPVIFSIPNPLANSGFKHFQIQTVRDHVGEEGGVSGMKRMESGNGLCASGVVEERVGRIPTLLELPNATVTDRRYKPFRGSKESGTVRNVL